MEAVRCGFSNEMIAYKAIGIWRFLKTTPLDEGGIDAMFSRVRDLLIATVIIAAGSYAARQQPDVELFGIVNLAIAGLGVAAIGLILVLPESARWIV
jgi:hypothetical protein